MRHIRDARALIEHSPDQSWHLAGFGPECARKACLSESWLDKIIGHDLTELSDDMLELALALDLPAGRYEVRNIQSRYPKLREWAVESRYDPTGTHAENDVRALVDESEALTYALASELWMDGLIDGVW